MHPARGRLPVLLSVSHSGRDYPAWLVAMATRGRPALATLEDPLVDRLAWRAIRHGIGAVIARAPRAAVDCNRAEDDIDPSVIEGGRPPAAERPRRGGLGIVPGRTQAHGYLWKHSIGSTQLEARLDQAHRPFHRAIEEQLGALVERFGGAVLLDCHSMPPPAPGVPPIVFGDCHGRSAEPWASAEAMRIALAAGFAAGAQRSLCRRAYRRAARRAARAAFTRCSWKSIDRCYLDDELAAPGAGFRRRCRAHRGGSPSASGEQLLGRQFATAAE